MKQAIKFSFLIFIYFIINVTVSFSQKHPITFLNTSVTISIDSTLSDEFWCLNELELKYRFINNGNNIITIDSLIDYQRFISNPKDTSTLSLRYTNFFKEDCGYLRVKNKTYNYRQNNTSFLIIPFYSDGKKYNEKLFCNIVFRKSKLLELDTSVLLVNDIIANNYPNESFEKGEILKEDTILKRNPQIKPFTVYFTIKNISNQPIWCTKELVCYYDTPIKNDGRDEYSRYVEIKENEIYKIPVQMNMGFKYRFFKSGQIIVFTNDLIEPYNIVIKSTFQPKGNYEFHY